MKTTTQITLDKWILAPVGHLLNAVIRLLGVIVRPRHDLKEEFATIAVCKFKGMGSIVHATPLLLHLRKQYPQAHIVFVSTEQNKSLLRLFPFVDQTLLLNDASFLSLCKSLPFFLYSLFALRVRLFIDLELYSHFSSIVVAASAAQNRLGYYLRASQYKKGIYSHMLYFNTLCPLSMTYLQMTRLLGHSSSDHALYDFQELVTPPTPQPHPYPQDLQAPYVVVNVNASDLRLERRWPASYFVSLLLKLTQHYPQHTLVFIGTSSEKDYTQQVVQHLPSEHVMDFSGKTSITGLIQLLAGASLVVTNDTGPLHLAAAVKTPVVALFGPCNPLQFACHIVGEILYKPLYCSPCVHEFQQPPCKGNNRCMQMITVDDVFDAAQRLLDGKAGPAEFHSHPVIYETFNDGWIR
jgi:ADP-heptose:LPS heptosyltransferase